MENSRQKILFLGGWGRSGSTVLANILGSAPGMASIGEARYLWDRGILQDKKCGCGTELRECRYWSRVFQAAGLILSPQLARQMTRSVGSRAVYRQLTALLTGRGAAYRRRRTAELAILERVYKAAFATARVGTIIDSSKTAPYILNLLGSPEFEVYFIHLVRDPRAVAHSWRRRKDTGEGPGIDLFPEFSPLRSALYWLTFNGLGALMRSRMPGRYLQVRYEDFCTQPRETVGHILKFCGLRADGHAWTGPNAVHVQLQHTVSGNPSRFRTGIVTIAPDDEWLNSMSAASRWMVTALCAPLLRVFGYPWHRPAGAHAFPARSPQGKPGSEQIPPRQEPDGG